MSVSFCSVVCLSVFLCSTVSWRPSPLLSVSFCSIVCLSPSGIIVCLDLYAPLYFRLLLLYCQSSALLSVCLLLLHCMSVSFCSIVSLLLLYCLFASALLSVWILLLSGLSVSFYFIVCLSPALLFACLLLYCLSGSFCVVVCLLLYCLSVYVCSVVCLSPCALLSVSCSIVCLLLYCLSVSVCSIACLSPFVCRLACLYACLSLSF